MVHKVREFIFFVILLIVSSPIVHMSFKVCFSPSFVRNPSSFLSTEYIDRPLLINGLKFDLRIYVLILNLYPLEIFLYDEGLVRFATVDYKAPSTDNLHQTFMHLTNYSLNKRSASYKHTVDQTQTDGSKRKLSTVWMQLIHMFGHEKIDRTKLLITEMINKTILAILPELRVEYEYELPLGKRQNISCFQVGDRFVGLLSKDLNRSLDLILFSRIISNQSFSKSMPILPFELISIKNLKKVPYSHPHRINRMIVLFP